MIYRMRMASLSQGVDLEGVQADIDELEKVYFESEQFLGTLTEGKKESIKKSAHLAKQLVGVIRDYKADCASNQRPFGEIIRLKIA
jgi:16S rRNA U516 pseudouridylate synthase RsuA-like enzyme